MDAEHAGQSFDAPGDPSKRRGLGSLIHRMRTVLRKSKSTPNLSPLVASHKTPDEPVPALPRDLNSRNSTPPVAGASPVDAQMAHLDLAPDATVKSAELTSQQVLSSYKVTRQQLWEQRALSMLEKYDLSVEADFKPLGPTIDPTAVVERVRKPVRMRVHRYCHRCERVFGPERICAGCEHRRCKKCPRYPREKSSTRDGSQARKAKSRKEEQHVMSREPLLILANPRTGGQILVHNRIVQRVHRKCHRCDTEFFPSTARTCQECGHARCSRCPRTPANQDKWKPSPVGDAAISSEEEQQHPPPRHLRQERVFRKPRQRVRWNCDQCNTLFLEGQKVCRQCGHEKCPACGRNPPKKIRQDFDPEVVRTLNEKLSALVMTSAAE